LKIELRRGKLVNRGERASEEMKHSDEIKGRGTKAEGSRFSDEVMHAHEVNQITSLHWLLEEKRTESRCRRHRTKSSATSSPVVSKGLRVVHRQSRCDCQLRKAVTQGVQQEIGPHLGPAPRLRTDEHCPQTSAPVTSGYR